MDRRRNQLGAIPHELYRHSREVEANAIRNDCRFHELEASDLPVGVLLTAIQPSSLGTVGCAFAGVSEWSTTGINTKPAGSCYSFNEPNHRTSCDTPQAATATELRAKCERLTRHHVTRRMDSELIEVLKIPGTFDEIVDKTVAMIESKNDTEDAVLPVDEWIDKIIGVRLDSGACDHILDLSDAPGYANFLGESPGSKRGQEFVVGNGAEVPNEGQLTLNLEANGGGGKQNQIKSIFQFAEITPPLMSVSRIGQLGHKCVFDAEKAEVVTKNGVVPCTFQRKCGLYVAQMKLKSPEGFQRPAR